MRLSKPSAPRLFQLVAAGLITLVTVMGLAVLIFGGGLDNLFTLIFIPSSFGPVAIYYFKLTKPGPILVCGVVLLATLVPAWLWFIFGGESLSRTFYVMPALVVSLITCLFGWAKEGPPLVQ